MLLFNLGAKTFDKSFDIYIRVLQQTQLVNDELQFIIDKMEDGVPLTVGFDTSATSAHAITAMRMFRDFYDPFTYYLECYDNNTLAEPYLLKICLSDMNLWNRTNANNWGKNYSVRPYRLVDGEWEAISLRFYEVYP